MQGAETKERELLPSQERSLRKRFSRWFDLHPIILSVVIAILLTLIIEILSRRSFGGAFAFLAKKPHIFLLNALIIMLTMTPGLFTTRKTFFFFVIPLLWFIFGCVNFILVGFRPMPFSAIDFLIIRSVRSIVLVYLSVPELILICAGFVALITLCVIFWQHSTRNPKKIHLRRALPFALSLAVIIGVSSFILEDADALGSDTVGLMPKAYDEYGFVYCFSYSIFDWGVDRPEDYSEESIKKITKKLSPPAESTPETTPNIIFIQLESFYDITNIAGIEASEELMPNFRALQKECSTGAFAVNTVGAGTANTEFETITGMDLSDFSMGEYPYRTVLHDTTCESACYDLAPYGYTSHAIHNNTATFYDRNVVFPMLGFDSFTSVEYMNDIEYIESGWVDDSVLVGSIADCLASTEGSDFIYTISVQPHGEWPEEGDELPIKLTVDGEEAPYPLAYFANQIWECDEFLGELIAALEQLEEDTVLVAYGDHFPDLDYKDEDLLSGTVYATEYIIWSNFGLEKQDRDLRAYQLYAFIMDSLGMHGGILSQAHVQLSDNSDYPAYLSAIEYDMLYGKKYSWNGEHPYEPSEMRLGVKDIAIASAEYDAENSLLTVYGENFTPWSVVRIDGRRLDTEFIDANTLAASCRSAESGSVIDAAQITDDSLVLSSSNEYVLP